MYQYRHKHILYSNQLPCYKTSPYHLQPNIVGSCIRKETTQSDHRYFCTRYPSSIINIFYTIINYLTIKPPHTINKFTFGVVLGKKPPLRSQIFLYKISQYHHKHLLYSNHLPYNKTSPYYLQPYIVVLALGKKNTPGDHRYFC